MTLSYFIDLKHDFKSSYTEEVTFHFNTFMTLMFKSFKWSSGPMPDSMRSFGLSNAPAANITSFRTLIVYSRLSRTNLIALT